MSDSESVAQAVCGAGSKPSRPPPPTACPAASSHVAPPTSPRPPPSPGLPSSSGAQRFVSQCSRARRASCAQHPPHGMRGVRTVHLASSPRDRAAPRALDGIARAGSSLGLLSRNTLSRARGIPGDSVPCRARHGPVARPPATRPRPLPHPAHAPCALPPGQKQMLLTQEGRDGLGDSKPREKGPGRGTVPCPAGKMMLGTVKGQGKLEEQSIVGTTANMVGCLFLACRTVTFVE